MALTYATNPRGGDHTRGATVFPEIFGIPKKVKSKIIEGKAEIARELQDLGAANDSNGVCMFATVVVNHEPFVQLLNAATGLNFTLRDYQLSGERTWNVERLFNVRAGLKREADSIPKRLLEEPVPDGPTKGEVAILEPMLEEYYRLRGWDKDGVPTQEKLKELGIVK